MAIASDEDQDGVCDFDEAGCKNANACNFAPLAQEDDGSCTYPETCFDCTGACLDENTNGICDCDEVYGCTDNECNFQPAANVDDGSCAPWVYVTGAATANVPPALENCSTMQTRWRVRLSRNRVLHGRRSPQLRRVRHGR